LILEGEINIIHFMQAPKPKEVHAISGEIIRLEKELAQARAKYNALFGIEGPKKRTRAASSDGFTAKVLEFVESHAPGFHLTIPFVAESLDEPDLTVGKVLYKLAKAEKIANPKRGVYEALEKEAPSEEKTS
jgi:hypothetical protein